MEVPISDLLENKQEVPIGPDLATLKRKSVRGGVITMGSQGISIIIHLISTVVLARLLTPEDYGVIAMVLAITAFAGLFRDLGLSAAAIQKKDLTQAQQSNLFWLNVAMGMGLTGLVAACSPLVAWFYGKPELTFITLALSASFVIVSFGTQYGACLVRNMQFGRKAFADISGALVAFMTAIALALQGFSYWSVVWGNLAGALTTTVVLFLLSPFRPGLPARSTGVREMLKFGANVTAFEVVNYFHRNLDNILIGRFWGADALGLYSRAYALLMFPIHAIRGPIEAVAFPAMSKLQSEPEAFRAYYRSIVSITAMMSMPLAAFLIVVPGPIIELALGNQWSGVVPIFTILAITAFIQPVAGLRGVVLISSGQGRRYFIWGILNAVCVSIGFLIGIRWGPIGVAMAYAIVNYAILYPSLLFVFANTSIQVWDFFQPVLVPAVAAMAAGLIAFVTITLLSPVLPGYIPLLLFAAVPFVTIYIALILFNVRERKAIFELAIAIKALIPTVQRS